MTKNILNTILIALAELIITPLVVISADRTLGRIWKDTRCQSIVKKYKSWTRENSFASSIFSPEIWRYHKYILSLRRMIVTLSKWFYMPRRWFRTVKRLQIIFEKNLSRPLNNPKAKIFLMPGDPKSFEQLKNFKNSRLQQDSVRCSKRRSQAWPRRSLLFSSVCWIASQ